MTPNDSLASAMWPHQRDAVKVMAKYLASQPRSPAGAGLVTMPTGAGKTAVIAGVIDSRRRRRHWLVIVPRRSLVRQVRRALDGGLWRALGVPKPPTFPPVRELPVASRIDEVGATATPTVFVGTFQKLLSIDAELGADVTRRRACFAGFDAALVDEGHYEPSPEWSGALRSLGLPVVLFTATPYRNDELHFETEPTHRFWYRHHEAVADGRLRQPRFVTFADGGTERFVDDVIAFVSGKRLGDARVIIRCATADAIRACVAALHRGGQSAVGIHERFADSGDEHLVDRVPAPEDSDAQYWVHQYKLLEGIDDARFRVVAFHDPLNNDRAVVQQIGRVLRRPTSTPKIAWVLSRGDFDVEQIWERYLYFDLHGGESRATTPDFTQCLLDVQPVAAYYDRQFRAPIDLGDADLWRQFAYQPAARVYRSPTTGSLSCAELSAAIVEEYRLMGLTVERPMFPDTRTVIVGYVGIGNSSALLSGLFLEGALGFTVVRLTERRVFVFDSHNHMPQVIADLRLAQETRSVLSLLLDADARLTSVSLDNTDIGRRAIRSRTLRAASIEEVAPDLTDYAYVCNIAEGYTPNSPLGARTRRYVGMSRSRIRDGRGHRLTFEQFRDWVDTTDQRLDAKNATATTTLDRYADATPAPADPTARHLLLDVDGTEFTRTDASGTQTLDLDGIATEVCDHRVTLQVNGAPITATVRWNAAVGRYLFESAALKNLDYRQDTGRELTAVINTEQRLRIVPHAAGSVYVHGQFIAVPDPHTNRAGLRLLNVMTGMDELEDVTAEKSDPDDGRWHSKSVFAVIDKLAGTLPQRAEIQEMSTHFERLETLVCTDMQTEPCDFIAMQPDRIAFIHAKHGKGTKRSATVFHDVVGQAIKNLAYLLPSTQSRPRIDYWADPWPARGNGRTTLNRLRTPDQRTPEEIWQRARDIITDPTAHKEVWIVLGAGMSIKEVRAELDKTRPADEVIQIYALLQTAWSTVAQCSAQLRIFCSP
ncbi:MULTISPECIES: DEAD/DEAH box helicase [unclassified Mycobacterium]|uniref:DEAD/DEAH box helicase n=1 Tax=unclassified Mycobacterium TaxID=2642494 RepID=UPI0029C93B2B|nr:MULTISPECIES: DEAD/DEAH box helicase family protein [unclassified Mycobacterium]